MKTKALALGFLVGAALVAIAIARPAEAQSGGSWGGRASSIASRLLDQDGYVLDEAVDWPGNAQCRSTVARDASTTTDTSGMAAVTAPGSSTPAAVTVTNTNKATATVRVQSTSGTAANNIGGWSFATSGIGIAPFLDRAMLRFGLSSILSGQAVYVGIGDIGVGFAGDPSAITNTIYVGCDAADDNLSVCSNDGSGSATCTALGASFPCKTGSLIGYDFRVAMKADGSGYRYKLIKHDGTSAGGTLTTNLPASGTRLRHAVQCSARSSGSACVIHPSQVSACGPVL